MIEKYNPKTGKIEIEAEPIAGTPGARGEKGDTGLTGARGERGLTGARGEKGDKGDPGKDGKDGVDGKPGIKGDKGDDGKSIIGPQGIKGIDGNFIHYSIRMPKKELGQDGDWCFCETEEIFRKVKGEWKFYRAIRTEGSASKGSTTTGGTGVGTGVAFVWRFDTGLTAGTASGDLRYNNATPASVTAIYINETSNNNSDLMAILALISTSTKIYIQQADDSTKFLVLSVSSATTDNGTDWTIPVTVEDSGALPDNNAQLGVIFFGAAGTSYTDEQAQDAVFNAMADSASIDMQYNDVANSFTAVVLPAGVDHNSLANLTTGDPHTQYALESSLATVATTGLHSSLSGIGTNSHSTIDSHLANNNIHVPAMTAGSVVYHNGTILSQDNATFFWDSTNKRLGLGTGAATNITTINGVPFGAVLTVGADGVTDLALAGLHRHSATAAFGAHLNFIRSRGASGAETIVSNSDVLGIIWANGHNGSTGYSNSSAIKFVVDGTVGATSMPGKIIFQTSPASSQTLADAMSINSSQVTNFVNHPTGLVTTSVDNTIPRFDGTAGRLQTSVITIADIDGAGLSDVSGIGKLSVRSTSYDGNMSSADWGMAGLKVTGGVNNTLTNTTVYAGAGVVSQATSVVLSSSTIAATDTDGVTYTNYYGAYAYEPVAGANVTLTNKWGLGADSLRIGNTNNFCTITSGGIFRASALTPFANSWFLGKGYVVTCTTTATGNVNLATGLTNGTTLNGITLRTGQGVLVKNQTNPAENGIYLVPASGAASRRADANTWAELENIVVYIPTSYQYSDVLTQTPTNDGGTVWRTYDNTGGTLGTTAVTFEQYYGPNRISINVPTDTEVSANKSIAVFGLNNSWTTAVNGLFNVTGTTTYTDREGAATAIVTNPLVNYDSRAIIPNGNSLSIVGGGFLFWAHGTLEAAGNAGLGPFYTLVGQMTVENTGSTNKTMAIGYDVLLGTTFKKVSTGTLTITTAAGVVAGVTADGSTLTKYSNYVAQEAALANSGAVTKQVGLAIQHLTKGTSANFSIYLGDSATIATGNYSIFQDDVSTYPSRWNGGHQFAQRANVTGAITTTLADHIIVVTSGTFNCTLHASNTASKSQQIILINDGAGIVTFVVGGADAFVGTTTVGAGARAILQSDSRTGAHWRRVL